MATHLAPKPVGNEPDGDTAPGTTATDREVVDLTALQTGLGPDAAADLDLFEVELPRSVGTERISTRIVATGVAAMLAVVLAPLLVLLLALAVPTTEQLQGAVLVVGWVGLAAVARWIEVRRTQSGGGRHR